MEEESLRLPAYISGGPGSPLDVWDQALRDDDDMTCNLTCCALSTGTYFCSIEHNFTEYYNVTQVPAWDLALRYTYAVSTTLIGTLGNLIIISIIWRNRLLLRASVNNFILNMSVADSILAITGPILFTIRDTHIFWVLGPVWCHLEGYIQETVLLVSVSSMTVISVDRMWGIVRPLHKHMEIWVARLIILGIWVASGLLAVPFAVYRKYTVRLWADGEETICKETVQMGKWWFVSNVFLIFSPLVITITCYTIIFIKFRKYDREIGGPEHIGLRHTKKRVLKMMFVVVVVFICCWSPFLAFSIYRRSIVDENDSIPSDKETTYSTLLSVANYMLFMNPVADPAVYALMHENFRRAFRVTYRCCYKAQPPLILTRGTGNRGFMWSARTTTSPEKTSRASGQSKRSSRDGGRPTRCGAVGAPSSAVDRKERFGTWTLYGRWKYPHSARPAPHRAPDIPPTIMEVSKESSDRSLPCDPQTIHSKTHSNLHNVHIAVCQVSYNISTSSECDTQSHDAVTLKNGHVTLGNGDVKPPINTPGSLHGGCSEPPTTAGIDDVTVIGNEDLLTRCVPASNLTPNKK